MPMTLTPPDLTSCDREVIHAPGSIQPFGMMLVAALDGQVTHVAGEVERRLGVADWQGKALGDLIGGALSLEALTFAEPGAMGGYVGRLYAHGGETLDVSAHLSGAHIIVELEAAPEEDLPAALMMDRLALAAGSFDRAASLISVCERAAIEFRRLTRFDRVMIYRFLDDAAGKVLAESRRSGLHSFLNHHFPASDIPAQARALYTRNLVRVIPDVSYRPAPLRPAWTSALPLDMSDSSLRSVSPLHLLYLSNMGVTASASFSIIKEGVLWGLVACHNHAPRRLAYDTRAACRALAGSLARQIKAKEEADGYRQRIRLRSFEDEIVALLSREGKLDETLSNHLNEICRMMGGDGVAVLRGRELVLSGVCPDEPEVRSLAPWLLARTLEPVFSTSQLADLYPPGVAFRDRGAGLLAVTLSAEEPWLLIWFRSEQLQVVEWAGNPHKGHDKPEQPLTPRASFATWRETVQGRARAWTLPEVEAATRLRAALLEVRQNRRMKDLNRQLTKILQDKDLLLQQKEFLIGEVNHRVQNSLQLVSSFLALQARSSENPALHDALEEARRRLSAVALVHRRLYRGDQFDMVNAGRYIEELCADTFSFMGHDWARHLTLDLSPVLVSTDRAVVLGLVLTELLINCNKYAYDGAAGPVEIGLHEDRIHLHLTVADKGAGRTDFRKGFGSRIMDGLVTQLGGTLTHADNQPGLRAEVVIPVETPKRPG